MFDLMLTPESLLHPLAAAVVGELLTLWLERYLKEWRYTPLLTLILCILVQLATALTITRTLTLITAWKAAWFGFLGASVAVFGREVVLNIVGLFDRGPRDTTNLTLGTRWKPGPNIYRIR